MLLVQLVQLHSATRPALTTQLGPVCSSQWHSYHAVAQTHVHVYPTRRVLSAGLSCGVKYDEACTLQDRLASWV